MHDDIDILMITYNRAAYTRRTLARLLDTCDDSMRVWVWHNGTDAETLAAVEALLDHPRLHRFHHSPENKKLNEPTNWLWSESNGSLVSKVDDDCLVPHGWADVLRRAHRDNPEFGVVGCWHFRPEDLVPEVAERKIHEFNGGHKLMRHCWLGGSGYLMKRQCVNEGGLLGEADGFTSYCLRLSQRGWIHGWYYPFIYQDHLDDPRSEYSLLKRDSDVAQWAPLSAVRNGVTTVAAWQAQLERSARYLQSAPFDPRFYTGWRRVVRRVWSRLKRALGYRRQW